MILHCALWSCPAFLSAIRRKKRSCRQSGISRWPSEGDKNAFCGENAKSHKIAKRPARRWTGRRGFAKSHFASAATKHRPLNFFSMGA
jgi:hypothetical protein